MNPLPSWLQSSVDPTQPSLTIESLGKVLVGLVGMYAASQGLDTQTATSQAQLFIDQGMTIAVSGFTIYQAVMAIYGLMRKLFMHAATPTLTALTTPTTITPTSSVAPTQTTQAVSVPAQWDQQSVG